MVQSAKNKRIFIVTVILVVAAFIVSICVGKYQIGPATVWKILMGGETSEMAVRVFYTLRLPRTLMALIAGVALGFVGSVYQTIFKNPLASPDIIGVANGANLGAAVAIILFSYNTFLIAASAFFGGTLVMLLVIALVRSMGDANTTTYILAGIVLKAVSESMIMLLKLFADPSKELAAIEFWSMGSFGNITASKLFVVFPLFLLGFLGLILLRRQIALLGLEDEESRALGVRIGPIRIAMLGFSTLIVTSVICMTGLISFIGLIAPHIARLALKRTSFATCVLASFVGAFILLTADCLARSLYSAEIPISILTTFIGLPSLIYFMRSRKARRI